MPAPDGPPPLGQSPDASLARNAAAPLLGVPPDEVQAELASYHDGVRGFLCTAKSGAAGGPTVGVLVADGTAWTDLVLFRATDYGANPIHVATAVVVLHQAVAAAPLLPSKHRPQLESPAFSPDGSLTFLFEDRRARDRLTRATVHFNDKGGVASVDRAAVE